MAKPTKKEAVKPAKEDVKTAKSTKVESVYYNKPIAVSGEILSEFAALKGGNKKIDAYKLRAKLFGDKIAMSAALCYKAMDMAAQSGKKLSNSEGNALIEKFVDDNNFKAQENKTTSKLDIGIGKFHHWFQTVSKAGLYGPFFNMKQEYFQSAIRPELIEAREDIENSKWTPKVKNLVVVLIAEYVKTKPERQPSSGRKASTSMLKQLSSVEI